MNETSSGSATASIGLGRWWRTHAIATVNHVDVVQRVDEEAGFTPRYLFMILMSAGIALLGLLLSSPAVVIGAMLISPLMGPILGVGFALATFDFKTLRHAAVALAIGSVVAVLFTALIVSLSPLQTVTPEIAARTRPNLFDLLVALFSALAGSYAMIRERSGTIVGVAIATALMPPLAVVGFGLATGNMAVMGGALLLFVTNLVTIALSATGMARLYGFGGHLSPAQTRLQGLLLVATFVVLAVPLALTLRQIAWEALAARQAREAVSALFPDTANLSEIDIDYGLDPMSVRAVMFTPRIAPNASRAASATLSRQLGRPVTVAIDQVRTGDAARTAEAQRLASAQAGERAAERATDRQLRDRIAAVAGVAPEAVTVDPVTRRLTAPITPLPAATIATYRAIERRAAAGLDGWKVVLAPPQAPLPPLPADEAARAQAIDIAVWGAQRTRGTIGVFGPADSADALVAMLTERGVAARRAGNGVERLEWVAPAAP